MNETRRALLRALADGPVRGTTFAAERGISRAAVWKQVEALRADGFDIESTADGYVVRGVPDYGAAAVEFGLDAPYDVEFHDSLGSTNDRARALAASDAADVVVVAAEQTGSRGRLNRPWVSPRGGVWASLLFRPAVPPAHAPIFTMAMAVAVTRACREVGVDAVIKWPNDVLLGGDGPDAGTKLAGVLTEMEGEASRVSWVVLGVGVNVSVDAAALPETATSLSEQRGTEVDRRRFLQRVLELFDELRRDPEAVLPAWREHAATLGARVRVDLPDETVVGEAVDVVFPGALVVRTDAGERTVHSGDCEHLRSA